MEVEFAILAGIGIGIFAKKMRGRSGSLWGGLSLSLMLLGHSVILSVGGLGTRWTWNLFVTVGAIILLLGLKSLKTNAPAVSAPSATKTCPFCAESIMAAAIVCKHCGKDIPA